jgi:alpha-tubulin suppressor-like RCC1 family protein
MIPLVPWPRWFRNCNPTRSTFLYGCGSNQHGQTRPHIPLHDNSRDEDTPLLLETVVCGSRIDPALHNHKLTNGATSTNTVDPPRQLVAGGGHTRLITQTGRLYLWGWNDQGQCGTTTTTTATHDTNSPLPLQNVISHLRVDNVALGFSHTLAIEKETQQLFAWGDNTHGQCQSSDSGVPAAPSAIREPTLAFPGDTFVAIAAGIFHSAAINTLGQLVTWGDGKHGQLLPQSQSNPWIPPDGSRLVQVVCGRHHTAVVDDKRRIWTFGDNHYGQLGRTVPIFNSDGDVNNGNKKKKNHDRCLDWSMDFLGMIIMRLGNV